MSAGRLYESPYTDHAPHRPRRDHPPADVHTIVEILDDVTAHAQPPGAA